MSIPSYHCPLCIHPINDNNPVLIFLELEDNFINRNNLKTMDKICTTLGRLYPAKKCSELEWRIAASHHLKKSSLMCLNLLITKIQETRSVHIVVTSPWKNDGTLEEVRNQMFAMHSFSKIIIGKTPTHNSNSWAPEIKNGYNFESLAQEKYGFNFTEQAQQIDFWLREHKLENADLVIFNYYDGGFSKRFPNQFVEVPKYFQEYDVKKALAILKISD